MLFDRWVVAILAPLALWVLINALDDLVLDFAWLYRLIRRKGPRMPEESDLSQVPERRMAIFVPLWNEHRVIQNMVEHNIATQKYSNYSFFIGAYPNDAPTLAAVREVVKRFPNAHLAVCPHDGPTSKADCLNWIYQRMLLYEEQSGDRFEMILTHDAEDLVHPEALRWINYFAQWNDMVQIPVLALPTPALELTHGVYCDDFAEFQYRDMPSRHFLGGFIPSNGVGTGFSRNALERLALAHSNRIFEPRCLTEDYENGFRIHRLGLPQMFVPMHRRKGSFIATREYFPRTFRNAVRQRTRWVTGIGLQSWEMHGLRDSARQLYWFWRDRKSLLGSLTTPLSNLLFLYGAGEWLVDRALGIPWGVAAATHQRWLVGTYASTLALQAVHMGIRAWCSAQVYGWPFAAAVPIRAVWGNLINFLATSAALRQYFWARYKRRPLRWLKTEHAYPNRAALIEHKQRLGEVLVLNSYVSQEHLDEALASQPAGLRIGEWLVRLGRINIEELYEALALQQNVPLGMPTPEEVSIPVTRTMPASLSRQLQVLPFRIVARQLYVAGTDMPSPEVSGHIRRYSSLDVRFHLVTPTEFALLARDYLPVEVARNR